MVDRGYVRKDRMHLLPIDAEQSWVVDAGPLESHRMDIAPFVGIRHESIEKLTSELLDVPPGDANATLGANVGYVLGVGYKIYTLPTAVAIVMSAIDTAHDRLRRYLVIEDIPAFWTLTNIKDPAWRYRDIAIKLLMGRHVDIPRNLEEARAEFCEYEDEVCDQFRTFETNVGHRMAASAQKG